MKIGSKSRWRFRSPRSHFFTGCLGPRPLRARRSKPPVGSLPQTCERIGHPQRPAAVISLARPLLFRGYRSGSGETHTARVEGAAVEKARRACDLRAHPCLGDHRMCRADEPSPPRGAGDGGYAASGPAGGLWLRARNDPAPLPLGGRHSTVFCDALATGAWTLPSAASILTGLEVGQHRVGAGRHHLREADRPLAQRLREAGYETHGFCEGGPMAAALGFDTGFDIYECDSFQNFPWQRALEALGYGDRRPEAEPPPIFSYLRGAGGRDRLAASSLNTSRRPRGNRARFDRLRP